MIQSLTLSKHSHIIIEFPLTIAYPISTNWSVTFENPGYKLSLFSAPYPGINSLQWSKTRFIKISDLFKIIIS